MTDTRGVKFPTRLVASLVILVVLKQDTSHSDSIMQLCNLQDSGGRLSIQMPSHQYMDPHDNDKTVSWSSHLYHGNPHTWKEGICIESGPCGRWFIYMSFYPIRFLLAMWFMWFGQHYAFLGSRKPWYVLSCGFLLNLRLRTVYTICPKSILSAASFLIHKSFWIFTQSMVIIPKRFPILLPGDLGDSAGYSSNSAVDTQGYEALF